ncbi:hypothetical protein [Azospirillum brasilense]|uniref:Uncharacterized protein n=2 Tax=Azospirillum brasilense TaxID=192 RepID=A0ABU4P207_AZOBR|nr:hypothetical protein [Azospirillum brasilense]MDW7551741.1 hypothetical protein [Azospirillum brasilense]MDW7591176.1 hypothetical protein [Azospirillum brasilense]MDW7626346.1 hypothetical protein [Azospirillum brasilense]MDX5951306.1 hypothetical protein [Azospirillum brasilense]TVZ49270.1 hypothetical protein OH82_05844 [Azospirillum brasilense]
MNPAADTLALASIEVNLAPVAAGRSITVTWRVKPVFVRHRKPEEIAAARSVTVSDLPDPQPDDKRVQKPEWLTGHIGGGTSLESRRWRRENISGHRDSPARRTT